MTSGRCSVVARWSVATLAPLVAMAIVGCAVAGSRTAVSSPNESMPRLILARAENLAEAKRRVRDRDTSVMAAYALLMQQADSALLMRPVSVTEKQRTPPSGDKRDYMSMGPYWWPDSTKPDGLPFVRRDGRVYPGSRVDHDGLRFGRMQGAVEALALAHYFTGEARYGAKAGELLRVFFLDSATRMNPNLEFAQAVMGITPGRGIGMIDLRRVPHLLDAFRLLEGSTALNATEWAALRGWWQQYFRWSLDSKNGRDERGWHNNHGTWYDAQIGAIAIYLGNTAMAREILVRDSRARIDSQLDREGWQPRELERTRPFHYSVMNAEGFAEVAEMNRHFGQDLWRYRSAKGATIGDAVRILARFADSTVAFPRPSLQKIEARDLLVLLRRAVAGTRDPHLSAVLRQRIAADLRRSHRTRLLYPAEP